MAGATPIYSFPYPESSDLVAAYPALGQDLAEDIETVIAALPAGGLAHIATETFSAAATVSVNGVFTGAYDNYLIMLKYTASGGLDVRFRLRLSGTDNTANNYITQRQSMNDTAISGARATSTSFNLSLGDSTNIQNATVNMYSPALAEATSATGLAHRSTNGSITDTQSHVHTVSTAFDGFTIFTSTGTITGTIRLYGYENS